jgi:hypothetical protein
MFESLKESTSPPAHRLYDGVQSGEGASRRHASLPAVALPCECTKTFAFFAKGFFLIVVTVIEMIDPS